MEDIAHAVGHGTKGNIHDRKDELIDHQNERQPARRNAGFRQQIRQHQCVGRPAQGKDKLNDRQLQTAACLPVISHRRHSRPRFIVLSSA